MLSSGDGAFQHHSSVLHSEAHGSCVCTVQRLECVFTLSELCSECAYRSNEECRTNVDSSANRRIIVSILPPHKFTPVGHLYHLGWRLCCLACFVAWSAECTHKDCAAVKDRAKQALLAAQAQQSKRGRGIQPCIPTGKADPGRKRRRHSDPTAALATGPGETPPFARKMECDAQQRCPQTDAQGEKGGRKKQLSQFEAAFAGVVENVEEGREPENSQRLQNLATTMEWSMIENECKQLAAQVSFQNDLL